MAAIKLRAVIELKAAIKLMTVIMPLVGTLRYNRRF
jgi:hypothetical protein